MKMRKLISLVLALVMLMSFAVPVMAAEENKQAVAGDRLLSLGVIDGYTDGTLGLDRTITRAEITVILAKINGMGDAADLLKDTPSKFSDVKTNEWYTGWINLASSQGWVKGDPQGTFRPNDPVQYREIVTMLLKALGYDDNLPGDWPTNYLAKAASLGITKNIVSDSKAPAVRGDVFIMTSRTLNENTVVYDKDFDRYRIGEILLVAGMDFDKVVGRNEDDPTVVTDIPRVNSSLKDNQIRINNTTYKVVGDVDYEAIFGCDVDAWLNDDGEIVFIDIVSEEILFDALEDVNEDELTLVDADADYDIDEDVIFYVNGSSLKSSEIRALKDAKYDYAKVVLNEDGDVAFVDAYNWDDFVVVEEVKGDEIFGYGEELDAEDFTIVKDGKTIALEDIEKGDIVFYNSKAEFAEVFNSTVEGEIEDIFQDEFEVDGKSFDYVNENLDINVKYIDEDGDIADFDEDVAEQMQDEEGAVVVFMDRAGNAVFVSGDLGIVAKSTFGAVLYASVDGYEDTRGRGSLELKVVNEEGKAVTYTVAMRDLEAVEVDGTEVWNDDLADLDFYGGSSYPFTGIDFPGAVPNLPFPVKGSVVEITLDDSGDVVELGFFTSASVRSIIPTDGVESGDSYIHGYRTSSSVPVFVVDEVTGWDDEDVEATTFGELEKDVDLKTGSVVHDGSKVLYLVVTDSDMQKTTTKTAVLTQVRKDTDGKISRIKALVDGEEVTYYAEDPITAGSWKAGDAAKLVIIDANGRVKDIDSVRDASFVVGNNFAVVTRDREIFSNASTSWKLVDSGYIYDITDPTDIEAMTFSELKGVNVGSSITVVLDGTSNKYAKYILVDEAPEDKKSEVPTDGTVTYIDPVGDYVIVNGEEIEITASAKEFFKNGLIARGTDIAFELTSAGKMYAITAIDADLTIGQDSTSTDIVIEFDNLTVDGDLVIEDGADVTASNVTVTGNLTVNDTADLDATNFVVEGTTTLNTTGTVSFNSELKGDVTVKKGTVTFKNVEFGKNVVVKGGDVTIEDSQIAGDLDAQAAVTVKVTVKGDKTTIAGAIKGAENINPVDLPEELEEKIGDLETVATALKAVNVATSHTALQEIIEENAETLGLAIDDEEGYAKLISGRKTSVSYDLLNNRPTGGYTLEQLQEIFDDIVATRLVTQASANLFEEGELEDLTYVQMLIDRFNEIDNPIYKQHSSHNIKVRAAHLEGLVAQFEALDEAGQEIVLGILNSANEIGRSQESIELLEEALEELDK